MARTFNFLWPFDLKLYCVDVFGTSAAATTSAQSSSSLWPKMLLPLRVELATNHQIEQRTTNQKSARKYNFYLTFFYFFCSKNLLAILGFLFCLFVCLLCFVRGKSSFLVMQLRKVCELIICTGMLHSLCVFRLLMHF